MMSGLIRPARVETVLGDDEHGRIRSALLRAVAAGGGRVVGEAATGRALLPLVASLQPQLIVLDLAISGSAGMGIVPGLLRVAPRSVLAIFDPLVSLRYVDLVRVRVIEKSDPRQLRDLVRELAVPIAIEAARARSGRPTT